MVKVNTEDNDDDSGQKDRAHPVQKSVHRPVMAAKYECNAAPCL
jgi:hypothetical protein